MCLLLLLVGTVSHAQNNVIDEVVWVVGDEAILKSDVEDERLQAQYEGRRFDGDPYCVIPEELAIQKLYLHQAEIDSVTVSEQAVLQEVETYTAWLIEEIGTKEKWRNTIIKPLRRFAKCCAKICVTSRSFRKCSVK